jgi:PAS domain S-box-containing protein
MLVDSVVDYAIYLLDLDGIVKSWNAGAQRIKGYSAQEILGSNFTVFYTDADIRAGAPRRSLEIARTTGRFEGEGWRLRKDGTRLWASVVIDAVYSPTGTIVGFAKVTRDVTQRLAERTALGIVSEQLRITAEHDRATAAILRENNRLMAMAEHLAGVGYWRIDPVANTLTWSDEIYRILGLPKSHRPDHESELARYHPDDRLRVTGFIERSLKDGIPFSYEARIAGADAGYRDVICSGQVERSDDDKIAGIFGVFQDITERKAAERARERLIVRVGLATQVARVGIWDWDVVANTIDCDRMQHRLFGFDDGKCFPNFEAWTAAIHDADRARVVGELREAAAGGAPYDSEFRTIWPNGEIHIMRAMATVVRGASGSVERMIGTNWDVTEVRGLTEQLQVAAERDRATAVALGEKNRLMAMAEQMVHVGHWRHDIPSNELSWSAEVYRTFGVSTTHKLTLDEAIAAYHPDDREHVLTSIQKAIEKGALLAFEARVVRPDATTRNIICNGQAELASDGTVSALFGVFQDVTDLKEAERERQRLAELALLQRSEKRANDLAAINELMAMAQEMTSVGYWHFDLHTRERQWSNEVYRIFGFDTGDPVPPEQVPNAYAAEDRDRIAAMIDCTLKSGSAYGFETRLTRKNGSVRDVVVTGRLERANDGTPLVLKGAIQDVTDRKILARDRDRLITRVGLATRAARVGIWDWDMVTNVTVWDPMMFALYGFDDAPFVPEYTTWSGALHPDDRARAEREIAHAVATGTPLETEFRIVWPNGQVHHIQSVATVVCDATGSAQRLIGTNWDVTEVRTLALQLREEQQLLVQTVADSKAAAYKANRAKSDFLAHMSHEIRTPMNGIIGFAAMVLESELTPEQRSQMTYLHDAGKSLLVILNDILDFSKIEAGKLEIEQVAFSPRAVVDAAIAIIRSDALAKAVKLECSVASDVPQWVIGDPTRLRQVLLNLLTNALKFTSSGRISVAVRRDACGPNMRFEVADSGIGIPFDQQHLLFHDFVQITTSAGPQYGGTGLGLAVSQLLVHAMNGAIGMTSLPGRGSTFWFTALLPTTGSPAATNRDVVRSLSCRVLVVDDNTINQLVVQAMLKKDGHDAVLVSDGAQAVEAVQVGHFDLVLMDMQMPVMTGEEATRAIRELSNSVRNIPIVALTANAMAEDIQRCHAAGMNDHLAKPVDRELLRRALTVWAGRRAAA